MIYIQNSFKKGCYDLVCFNASLKSLKLLNIKQFKQFDNGKLVLTVYGNNYRINGEL